MLSLLKRKSEAAASRSPAWHPDFRNADKLPDIKAVRTAFFVNIAAFVAAACAGVFVVYNEYRLSSARSQLAELQVSIDRDSKSSAEAIGLFRDFREREKRIQEIDAFLKSRPVVSPILIHLGQTLPPDVALSYFEVVGSELLLHAVVQGAPELASAKASSYLDALKGDAELAALMDSFSLVGLNPDPNTGLLKISLRLRFKAQGKQEVRR